MKLVEIKYLNNDVIDFQSSTENRIEKSSILNDIFIFISFRRIGFFTDSSNKLKFNYSVLLIITSKHEVSLTIKMISYSYHSIVLFLFQLHTLSKYCNPHYITI